MRSVRDNLGRVKTATYTGGRILTYKYTGDGQFYSVCDQKNENDPGVTYQYSYDSLGRLMSGSVIDSSGNVVFSTRQTYDSNNQLSGQQWRLGTTTYSETYTYSKTTGLLATHKPAVGNTLSFTYDALQRLSSVTGGIYGKTYTYRDISGTDKTTTQVASLTYGLPTAITYGYTYDALGNIATYNEAGTTYTYTYDAQNQLTKQTGGGKTYTYSYDAAGNILSASNGTTSHTYAYENTTWRDLLTKFDGQSITYDNAGNPTSYYNDARWTMTWAEGRRLVTASKSGTSLSFTYDSDGLRLSKNVNGTVHNYSYAGSKLMRETWGSNTLDFFYDSAGTPYALKYNGTLYYYITNLQGDVLKIVNTSGTPVVSYSYDPYGKPTVTSDTSGVSLGTVNPLRYRGYVYDTESGLYYLQSRYYDPTTGRFINADAYTSTGQGILGNNMFAYCGNNPVFREDDGGKFWNIVIGAVVGAAASVVTQVVSNLVQGKDWTDSLASAAVVGAVGGAVAATGLGAVAQAAWTAVAAATGDALQQGIDNGFDEIDPLQSIRTGLVAGATSLIGSYAGKKFFGGIEDLGNTYISKGHQKNLAGVTRALGGKSHTSYYRSGTALVAKGNKLVNFYRGASSSIGSLIGISTGLANNLIPR